MIRPPSDFVVVEVERCGGLAPADSVERAVSVRMGRLRARRAIGLAVVFGRLERVTLLDGSAGLQLTEGSR